MAITRTAGRVHLDTTEDVVAWLAASVAKTIANAGHAGHDLETVLTRMTSDAILDTIRSAYTHWASQGRDRRTGIEKIGVRLIHEYRRTYGI